MKTLDEITDKDLNGAYLDWKEAESEYKRLEQGTTRALDKKHELATEHTSRFEGIATLQVYVKAMKDADTLYRECQEALRASERRYFRAASAITDCLPADIWVRLNNGLYISWSMYDGHTRILTATKDELDIMKIK